MADKRIFNKTSTNRTKVLSRGALLEWVNTLIDTSYKKIEELCSGVAYCQIVEILHPNCIAKSKIKCAAKLECEYTQNFRLLQLAFKKLNVDKRIPIERLVQRRVPDSFEFLQWFRKFYDAQLQGGALQNLDLDTANSKFSDISSEVATISKNESADALPKDVQAENISRTPPPEKQPPLIFPVDYLEAASTLGELKDAIKVANIEKDFYLNKLSEIKTLVKKNMKNNKNVEFCKRVLEIIDAADDTKEADKIAQI